MGNEHWPKGLRELAEVVGEETALILASEIGGVSVYVPETPTDSHWLADLIGIEALGRLSGVYGRDYITVPKGAFLDDKKGQIKKLWETGNYSKRQIAKQTRSTERYVRLVTNDNRPKQATLPFD